jgi:hypothetical protein
VESGFEIDPGRTDELGAPVLDVAQEAVDATAGSYASDAAIDVEDHLRAQLSSRGLRADDAVVAEVATAIRSGDQVTVGNRDGSVER